LAVILLFSEEDFSLRVEQHAILTGRDRNLGAPIAIDILNVDGVIVQPELRVTPELLAGRTIERVSHQQFVLAVAVEVKIHRIVTGIDVLLRPLQAEVLVVYPEALVAILHHKVKRIAPAGKIGKQETVVPAGELYFAALLAASALENRQDVLLIGDVNHFVSAIAVDVEDLHRKIAPEVYILRIG